MYRIDYSWSGPHLDDIGRAMNAAVNKSVEKLTQMMFDKVMENLTGKILQTRTGALVEELKMTFVAGGDSAVGTVFMDPASTKAWVLEKGGEEDYPIVPVNAKMLHFFAKDGREVFSSGVSHPPSKAFGYLLAAFEEMKPIVTEELNEAAYQGILAL